MSKIIDRIRLTHPFSDIYYRDTVPSFVANLDSLKDQIESHLKQVPEVIDSKIEVASEKGYYNERHITITLLIERPMNETELERQAYNAKKTAEWERQQYEKLKAKFESK
jgi:RNAse (barnase) inhibitor barstar